MGLLNEQRKGRKWESELLEESDDEGDDNSEEDKASESKESEENDLEEYEFANSLFRKINQELVKIRSNPQKLFGSLVDEDNNTISQHAFKTAIKRKLQLSHSDKNLLQSFVS